MRGEFSLDRKLTIFIALESYIAKRNGISTERTEKISVGKHTISVFPGTCVDTFRLLLALPSHRARRTCGGAMLSSKQSSTNVRI